MSDSHPSVHCIVRIIISSENGSKKITYNETGNTFIKINYKGSEILLNFK